LSFWVYALTGGHFFDGDVWIMVYSYLYHLDLMTPARPLGHLSSQVPRRVIGSFSMQMSLPAYLPPKQRM